MSEPTADCVHRRVVPPHGILASTPVYMPRCRKVGNLSEPTTDCTVAAQACNQEMGGAHDTGNSGPIATTQPLCRKVGALSEPTAVRTNLEGGVSEADLEVTFLPSLQPYQG